MLRLRGKRWYPNEPDPGFEPMNQWKKILLRKIENYWLNFFVLPVRFSIGRNAFACYPFIDFFSRDLDERNSGCEFMIKLFSFLLLLLLLFL